MLSSRGITMPRFASRKLALSGCGDVATGQLNNARQYADMLASLDKLGKAGVCRCADPTSCWDICVRKTPACWSRSPKAGTTPGDIVTIDAAGLIAIKGRTSGEDAKSILDP
jgi:hypothetical protein